MSKDLSDKLGKNINKIQKQKSNQIILNDYSIKNCVRNLKRIPYMPRGDVEYSSSSIRNSEE
ncbi:MAG: hypothetical protein WDZ62_01610 [Candidatus Pacearchaeota archaeon]